VHEHIVYHFLHPIHYIHVGISYLHIAIDHAEQGRAEPPEPAPVETADYEQDQRQALVHLTTILEFVLFFFYLNCVSWMCIKLQELI
jgi:hypothetical protein